MPDRHSDRYFEGLEAELDAERAATLGRYGKRLEKAAARCASQLEILDNFDSDDSDALARYREARTAFLNARSAFTFQREMLGLLEHHRVDEIFPIPPSR